MIMGRLATVGGALALVAQAAPAFADDYLYKGDCERTRAVQQDRTIDTLLTATFYAGSQIAYYATDACQRDTLFVFGLTQSSRNRSQVVFSFAIQPYMVQPHTGTCQDGERLSEIIRGSVTFTTKLEQSGGVCELYVWSDWTRTGASGNQESYFSNRVTQMPGGFSLTQGAPRDGKFWSPIGFSEVR